MPRRCAVIGCLTKGSSLNKSFYRFPSDEELCKKWLKALCNLQLVKKYETDGLKYLNKNKFVCSDHFEAKYLRNVKAPSQGLFEKAVPSLNINLNVDALISSIQQSDILKEVSQPQKAVNKSISNTIKRSKEELPDGSENSEKSQQEIDHNKKPKISPKVKIEKNSDDIPLKQLFGYNVASINSNVKEPFTRNLSKIKALTEEDTKYKIKKKKFKNKVKMKECFVNIPKIEEVFLPSDKPDTYNSAVDAVQLKKLENGDRKLVFRVEKKHNFMNLFDPLGNISLGSKTFSAKYKKIKKKKAVKKKSHRRKKIVKKKNISKKDPKNYIQLVVPKTVDNNLKLSAQGPKKIIKVVVPQTNANDKYSLPSKVIKVIVPKKVINGQEVSLDKSEINKIVKLVSIPKNLDAQATKSNNSMPISKPSDNSNAATRGRTMNNELHISNCNEMSINNEKIKENSSQNITGGEMLKIVAGVSGNSKILKPVPPPKNMDGKIIKLINIPSDNKRLSKAIGPLEQSEINNVICDKRNGLNVKKLEFGQHQDISMSAVSNNSCERHQVFQNTSSNPEVMRNVELVNTTEGFSNLDIKPIISHSKNGKMTDVHVFNRADKKQTNLNAFDLENSEMYEVYSPENCSVEALISANHSSVDACIEDVNAAIKDVKPLPQNLDCQNIARAQSPPKQVQNEEVDTVTKELCKRIKHIIGKRFGDTDLSSDEDSMDTPLINISKPEKTIKKLMDTYRNETKKCECDSLYQEKMKLLHQEEKDLKRKLKNVQKYVFHYKDNIRKRSLLVADLRKQIPVKKPLKTGQLIRTIMPLEKIKQKNPGTYRFSKTLKTFALDLFYSSPLSYNILEKMYFLPSRKTLKNWLTNPKNSPTDLFDETGEPIRGNVGLMECVDILDESTGNMIRTFVPIHHSPVQQTEPHTDCFENMQGMQENIDDLMFRTDLAEAIMNT